MLTTTAGGHAPDAGERPAATIADVARAAGVASATASRALNGGRASTATIQRVRLAADELGYRPSYIGRMLSSRRSGNVAAVVTSLERVALMRAVQGLQAELAMSGTSVTVIDLSSARENEQDTAVLLRERDRFDAIALLGAGEWSDIASATDARPVASFADLEAVDSFDAVGRAIEHLRQLGHRWVHYVGVAAASSDHADYDSIREASFARSAPACLRLASISHAEPTVRGGFRATVDALHSERPRPSAIIAGSAEMAAGIALAAARLGLRVPADLSVVGIEDDPLASVLGLTTIDVRSFERGSAAGRLLHRHVAATTDTVDDQVDVIPILRLRDSTAPPLDERSGYAPRSSG